MGNFLFSILRGKKKQFMDNLVLLASSSVLDSITVEKTARK
jgi:hypothetical protein